MSQRNSASKMLVFKFILCASLNMIIPIFTLGSMDSSIGILIALITGRERGAALPLVLLALGREEAVSRLAG